jgi:hypothetical protein
MMRVVVHAQFPATRVRAHADSFRAKWALTVVAGSLGAFLGANVPHLNPRKYPQSAHYSSETGKHRFSSDCGAIYTRVSTNHGLEQDFNSLDAQHGRCGTFSTMPRSPPE